MKLRIIIFNLFICYTFLCAQTYDKDWAIINTKIQSNESINIKEAESFNIKYKDQLNKFADNSTLLYSSLAFEYFAKTDYKNANENFLFSYHYSQKAVDTTLKPIAEYRLADFNHSQNNLIEAEKYYLLCLRPMSAILGQSSKEYTQIFYNYTRLIIDLGRYAEAKPYVEALLYYYKTMSGEKNEKYVSLLNYQGMIFQNTGNYENATEVFLRLVNENKCLEIGDTNAHITILNNLGDVYRETGKYDLALLYLKKAKRDFYKFKVINKNSLATIENNLALCYKAVGNTKEAEDSFNASLNIYKDLGETNSEVYSTGLSNKGDLLRELGRWGEATDILLSALAIRKKNYGTNTKNYANALSNLACVYFDAGYFKESLEKHLEANVIYYSTVGEWHQSYGNNLNSLSLCYLHFKDYKKAEECKVKALQIIEKSVGKNHYRYASYLISTCGLYRQTHQLQKAEINLKEALFLTEKNFGKNHDLFRRAQFSLAELYSVSKKYELASPLYFESLDYYSEQLNSYFDAMSEENQMHYFKFIEPLFQSYNIFVLNYNLAQPAKNLSEQTGRLLKYQLLLKSLLTNKSAKLQKQIFSSNDKELIKLYQNWVLVKNELINNFKSTQPAFEDNALVKKASDLEIALKAKLNSFSKTETLSFEMLKQSLSGNEAAIEIFKVNELINDSSVNIKYGVLIIKNNSIEPELVIFKNGNNLDLTSFNNYSKCIDEQLTDTVSYEAYFKSINNKLKGIEKIYISADGIFHKINLSGLYNPLTKKYVQEDYEIYLTSNIASIVKRKKEDKLNNLTACLFGYPDYDYDFKKNAATVNKNVNAMVAKRFGLINLAKLPGTKTEVEEISKELKIKNWNVSVFTEQFASEENLRNVNSPTILHIATHGYYLKDIESDDKLFLGFESSTIKNFSLLRSGIILAGAGPSTADTLNRHSENDGIVTAYEATLINLTNTELVILSACQTGLGDEMGSQGVAGLQRSFAIAGAKNIMMSLWPVDDIATKFLMIEFYKNYTLTKNIETAFKNAQNEVKKKYPHPYYWSAFVLQKTFN